MSSKATVLFVDDEERILRSLLLLFRAEYRVLTTTDAREALEIVRREPVHVIVSDQRMPLMRGCDLLRQVKELSPRTLRLLLTGYSEMDAIVSSVNDGEIFRYIAKPWSVEDIRSTVSKAAGIALSLQQIEAELAQPATAGLPQQVPRPGVLVIDQDEQTYLAVREVTEGHCEVRWGPSLERAFELLNEPDTAIVVSELSLGDEDLAGALKLLKEQHPELITLVLTSFQDTRTMIGLINEGQVFRFLPKPVRKGMLGLSLRSAIRHYESLRTQPALLRRHAVEPVRQDSLPLPGRILSYLGRLRGRAAGGAGG